MVKNKENVDIWMCPSKNLNAPTKELGLEKMPKYLFHGTSKKSWGKIRTEGLIVNKDRHYIFLTNDKSVALRFGIRLIRIETKGLKMKFWLGSQSFLQVLLIESVPPEKLALI